MKVRTVGFLSLVGMMLSSLTVWSLTPPAPTSEPETVAWTPPEPGETDPVGASFRAGNTLMVEGRLGNDELVADQDGETFLLVNVQADDSGVAATPAPLNLAIVIDRSGSMRGKRLENALDAASGMVRRLRDDDVVSVIAYNTTTATTVPPTTIDSLSRERVIRSLSGITAQGDTCISCGIDAAMSELRGRSGMVNRILLLSDGEATAGVRDEQGFRRIAERCRGMGASISSIGVDVDYNERVMSLLALESNGRHHFVQNASDLPRAFDDELDTLAKTVAKDAEVSVELAPGVRMAQVFDRSFRREGDRLVVPMGGFSAGEQKTLLVKLSVPRGAKGVRPIADVRMSYDDLVAGGRGSCDGKLSLLAGDKSSALDPLVQGRLLRSETAKALTEANQLFSAGRTGEAKAKLSSRLAALEEQKKIALKAAPARRRAELSEDLGRQASALGEAESGFASPPPAAAAAAEPAAAPEDSRRGRAQVKQNAQVATDLAF